MPIFIVNRDENGDPLYSYGSGRPVLDTTRIVLKGEMPDSAFCVSDEFFAKAAKAGHPWLDHAFLHSSRDQVENAEFDQIKIELATFLNENVKGPYYVRTGFRNNYRSYLGVTFLEEDDAKNFAAVFPSWNYRPNSIIKNHDTLKKWKEIGYESGDARLEKYTMQMPPAPLRIDPPAPL